jgi:predicted amidohydrolase
MLYGSYTGASRLPAIGSCLLELTRERIRVAALQYYIRPVRTFEEFRGQVEALVETAEDYQCHLLVFPEYFTIQLLTLASVKRSIREQIRDLAKQLPPFIELMSGLAVRNRVYIVAGTIPVLDEGNGTVYNDSYFFSPSGKRGVQGKLHMTRFEKDDWKIAPRSRLKVFDTEFGKVAITICYDVEFPEIARTAAREGAHILIVPSCTDDRQGYLRVRYCAQARAIENQMYVVTAHTVGSLPMVPAVSLNYGQASILTPSDFPFSRDGILAEGTPNQEVMVIGELNLKTIVEARAEGTVLPLLDSSGTLEVAAHPEVVVL